MRELINKKILITGCCGTVGKALIRRLTQLDNNTQINGIDVNESELYRMMQSSDGSLKIKFDLCDIRSNQVKYLIKDSDIVIHCAAYKHVYFGDRNIEELKSVESLEVYRWLMSLGEKLNDDPLSEEKRIEKNKVKKCQFDLFVDYENGKFKAWSKAMVAAGYAYVLIDIFNSIKLDQAKKITVDDFKKIKMDELLTMNRKTGFFEMIEMMIAKLKNVRN